jgi:hypothetical protein
MKAPATGTVEFSFVCSECGEVNRQQIVVRAGEEYTFPGLPWDWIGITLHNTDRWICERHDVKVLVDGKPFA